MNDKPAIISSSLPLTKQVISKIEGQPQDANSLQVKLRTADDIKRIDFVVEEMAIECDNLAKFRNRYTSGQDLYRRIMGLGKLGQLVVSKHELMKAEGLDPNSPAVQVLVRLILEKVKKSLEEDLHLDAEQQQIFLTSLPHRMEGWEEEVDKRVKQRLFLLAQEAEDSGEGRGHITQDQE